MFPDPEILGRAAASEAPVLILGEPGTGRSTLARELHRRSARGAGPLVELDPATLPPTLFESELFGYRAGAFTGAGGGSLGRVARAQNGTLLLDHLEDLPLAAQPKLLRLVAERVYAPLGGADTGADLRFLAIAGEDLPERVRRGAFRQDLYFRLEVLSFRLPPLRERRGELPELINALLSDLGERFGRPALELSDRARVWMAEYAWPGNLRELRNVLERALVLESRAILDPAPPPDSAGAAPQLLAEVEAEAIRRALAHTRGRQGRAAELLGISRKTLWEKRRRYGIP
ncbi:MAG TPA: sigma 54-interacting transcriptional regulator [Thermoanaerobaculia bacterium]|nr:sigma 54-interacting transcriptional regulator [Thermoanaerobaculia bacterium]